MNLSRLRSNSGFTLVELLIGMTLTLVVMAGVISCFIFLSHNLSRLQIQQKFESQGRRALLYFAQDARMASAITTPTATSVTFVMPPGSGSPTVTYNYNSATGVLTRDPGFTGLGSNPPLLVSLTSFTFSYYDVYGNPYPALTNYLIGIKQVSVSFNAQSPPSWNLTQPAFTYQVSSGRMILRNKAILP